MKLLFDDSDQHVGGHGAPDLRLHCVIVRAQKVLDIQVLLDPLEEQRYLPAALVQGVLRPNRRNLSNHGV